MQVNLMGLSLKNRCKVIIVPSTDVSSLLKQSEATSSFKLLASRLQTQLA